MANNYMIMKTNYIKNKLTITIFHMIVIKITLNFVRRRTIFILRNLVKVNSSSVVEIIRDIYISKKTDTDKLPESTRMQSSGKKYSRDKHK